MGFTVAGRAGRVMTPVGDAGRAPDTTAPATGPTVRVGRPFLAGPDVAGSAVTVECRRRAPTPTSGSYSRCAEYGHDNGGTHQVVIDRSCRAPPVLCHSRRFRLARVLLTSRSSTTVSVSGSNDAAGTVRRRRVTDWEGWVTERAARYREVFAVPEYRALFGAQLFSVIGDQFARVALAILVYDRTGSATLTALTYALTFLPGIVAGPLLSGLADRYPRRQVMVVADLARAGLVAVMAIPGMPFVWLCVLLVGVQMLAAPFDAARSSVVPQVFGGGRGDDRYPVANAISNITYQGGQLLGFAPAGLLVVGVSTSGALLLDAATFVVSAALVRFGVRDRPAPPVGATGLGSWGRRIAAGGRLVWADRRLRWLTLVLCVPAFPVAIEGLAVPYAVELEISTAAVGLLFAAEPAGSVLGMLLISRLPHLRQLRLMGPLAITSCAVLVVCAAQPGLLVTVALWFASGLASAYFTTANSELTLLVPDAQRGQVNGLVGTACRVSQGLGVLTAGVAADVVQPAVAIATAGAVGAVYAAVVAAGWGRAGEAAAGANAPADGVG